jgi:ribosomal protein S18 acetylase RimI-like enzyme
VTTRNQPDAPGPITVRRMLAEDWQNARCVRLAALADSPDAYGRSLDEEVALPDTEWQRRAIANAAGVTSCGLLAFKDDVPCGLVVGILPHSHDAELHGLWVAENIRRRGTGSMLVHAVCAWARDLGAKQITLKVLAANHGAIALYRATGFEPRQGGHSTSGVRYEPALYMVKRF